MIKFKAIYNNIKQFISSNDAEIMAVVSAFFIVYPSFLISEILGYYVLGIIGILGTVFLIKYPR